MKFSLEIQCDNAAFDDAPGEVARILSEVIKDILERGPDQLALFDVNGNEVGQVDWTED